MKHFFSNFSFDCLFSYENIVNVCLCLNKIIFKYILVLFLVNVYGNILHIAYILEDTVINGC